MKKIILILFVLTLIAASCDGPNTSVHSQQDYDALLKECRDKGGVPNSRYWNGNYGDPYTIYEYTGCDFPQGK